MHNKKEDRIPSRFKRKWKGSIIHVFYFIITLKMNFESSAAAAAESKKMTTRFTF